MKHAFYLIALGLAATTAASSAQTGAYPLLGHSIGQRDCALIMTTQSFKVISLKFDPTYSQISGTFFPRAPARSNYRIPDVVNGEVIFFGMDKPIARKVTYKKVGDITEMRGMNVGDIFNLEQSSNVSFYGPPMLGAKIESPNFAAIAKRWEACVNRKMRGR